MPDVSATTEFLRLQDAVAGRYSLVREIGRGGMGIVYLASDVGLERPVAIKLLPPQLASEPSLRERFLREARTAAQLMHPNVVPIHAVEERGDLVFFVMAFVDGETLTGRVARTGPLNPEDALRVMKEVAWALAYAHGRGVVHRDIKPDNILLERASGRAMVADFGIAHVASRETLSADGTFVGTIQYMSPEQASAEPVDARSDVYSLGATAWFSMTGVSPVEAPSLPAMLTRLLADAPPSIATVRSDVPAAFAEAVTKAMAKERDERFASADALAVALQAAERPVRAVRPEVRAFLREVPSWKAFTFAGAALSALSGVAWVARVIPTEAGGPLVGIGGGILALSLVGMVANLLGLQRLGVPIADVQSGIDLEIEEIENASRIRPTEAVRRGQARAVGMVMGMLGIVVAFLGGIMIFRANALVGAGFFSLGIAELALAAALIRARDMNSRLIRAMLASGGPNLGVDRLVLRMIKAFVGSRLARFLFRPLAGGPPAAPRTIAPTATLLLNRVEELVAQLPPELRTRLGDVLPATAKLERAHAALRERQARLDAAIAELPAASPARAEFTSARDRTAARLAECVAVLEGVRADLLRLGAGLMATEGLTSELEKARELSAAIDAELFGQEEVRRIVGR